MESFSFDSFADVQQNVLRWVNVTAATCTAAAINLKQLEVASLVILEQKCAEKREDQLQI